MAVTDYQSLYGICQKVAVDGISSVQSIGGFDTFIELHTQDDIDKNWEDIQEGHYDLNNNLITKCPFGEDLDESHLILVTGDDVTIPEGYTLTPINPKKSLVILCGRFTNNGTITMTAKGPNILPHDYFIIGQNDGYQEDIIIPAYANNQLPRKTSTGYGLHYASHGNNGVNRNCGSGGHGNRFTYNSALENSVGASGSGYAFGGGAGSGGLQHSDVSDDVDPVYPMRGGDAGHTQTNDLALYTQGGVGNPPGKAYKNKQIVDSYYNNFGVGGRIIIFCTKFENNGTISANGVSSRYVGRNGSNLADTGAGGASGGGAIDIFYTDMVSEGTITANGGAGQSLYSYAAAMSGNSGNGGNGCITLTQYNGSSFVLPGYANKDTITEIIRLTKTELKDKVTRDDITNITSLIPTLTSQLENDKGYIAREISAVEINNIWDNIFGV